MHNSWFTKIFIIMLFLASGFLFAEDKKTEDDEKEPIEVFAQQFDEQEIYDPLIFGGFVAARDRRGVGPEIEGTIDKIYVDLGSWVRAGQALYRLRPKGAGLDYRKHVVRSPISGVVSEVSHEAGDLVNAGKAVVVVADPRALEVEIHVTYDDLQVVKTGQVLKAKIASSTTEQHEIAATILAISPAADPKLGTFPVKLKLACKEFTKVACHEVFKLGSYVKVEAKKNVRRGILVPVRILVRQRRKALQVTGEQTAKLLDVKLGSYFGEHVEITSGIDPGMTLVTSFAKFPKNGDKVEVKEEAQERGKIFSAKDEAQDKG